LALFEDLPDLSFPFHPPHSTRSHSTCRAKSTRRARRQLPSSAVRTQRGATGAASPARRAPLNPALAIFPGDFRL